MSKKKKYSEEPPVMNNADVVIAEDETSVERYIDLYYHAYNNDYISQYYTAYKEMKLKEKAAEERKEV